MFKSRAQQKLLFATKPEVATEFADKTPKSAYKSMPEHVPRKNSRLQAYSKKHRRKRNGQEEL